MSSHAKSQSNAPLNVQLNAQSLQPHTAHLPKHAHSTAPHWLYAVAVAAYMNNDNRALSHFLKNPEASLAEKALIRARKEMKVGRYQDAREILDSFSTDSTLLRAERHFLRASLHSHASEWELALKEANQAATQYLLCNNERGLFLANYNLSVYYNRIGLDTISLHHVDEAAKHAKTSMHRSLIHRAKACHWSRVGQFVPMLSEIDQAMNLANELDDTERATLYAVAAELYFRGDRNERALDILEQLTNSKAIRDKARARFDLTVLKSLSENRNKMVDGEMPQAISENHEYLTRWQILTALQNGDLTQAEGKWAQLAKLFPLRFTIGFKTLSETDERSIFIKGVRTLMSQPKVTTTRQLAGKQAKLHETLQASPIALRKEELIERIWETSYHPGLDARFYKLIERMRKESGVQIEMINQTYRLKA